MRKTTGFPLAAGIVAGGISYGLHPYNDPYVLGINIFILMSLLAFTFTALLARLLNNREYRMAVLVALGVIVAVLIRIIFDTLFWDKTSHNLLPLEAVL